MALDLILQLVQRILSRFTHGTLMKMEHSHTLILAEVACGAVKNLDVQDQNCESSASGQYLTAHNGAVDHSNGPARSKRKKERKQTRRGRRERMARKTSFFFLQRLVF